MAAASNGPTPTVSICIPVYNGAASIGQALDSAIAQTFGDIEIVVVDNASTDDTLEVVASRDDPRVRVLVNESNIGAGCNWNRALAEARGEFVKILCADDYLRPECVERQLAALRDPANSSAALVSNAREIVDESGHRLFVRSYGGKTRLVPGRVAMRSVVRKGSNLIGEPSAVMFRASAAAKAGEFQAESTYCGDLDMWVRMLRDGDLVVLDEILSAYRVSSQSWTFAVMDRQTSDVRDMLQRIGDDPSFGMSGVDVWLGKQRVRLTTAQRRAFYRFIVAPREKRLSGN